MIFKIVYSFFLICSSLFVLQDYGVYFSLRQWSSILLLIACIYNSKNFFWDNFLKYYSLFLLSFGLSSLLDGYIELFIKRLIGDYFVAFVGCWGTYIMCSKYKNVTLCLKIFTILGLFSAVVSIFQLFNITYLDPFLLKFKLVQDQMQVNRIGADLNLIGRSISGVFTSATDNAHKLSSFALLSFCFLKKHNLINYAITLVIILGLFAAQVRTPFYATLFLFFCLFIRSFFTNKNKKIVVFIFLILMITTLVTYENISKISLDDYRYGLGLDFTGRSDIWRSCIDFICENPFLGGYFEYDIKHSNPHNLLLNMLVWSGLVGTICLIILMYRQILFAVKVIFSKNNKVVTLYCMAFLSVIIDSLTHNISIVNGDYLYWIYWGYIWYGVKFDLLRE